VPPPWSLNQPGSEISGPAFSPDGTRLYFSSQRGPSGSGQGVTYEVTGPFRASVPPTTTTTTTTAPPATISLSAMGRTVRRNTTSTWHGQERRRRRSRSAATARSSRPPPTTVPTPTASDEAPARSATSCPTPPAHRHPTRSPSRSDPFTDPLWWPRRHEPLPHGSQAWVSSGPLPRACREVVPSTTTGERPSAPPVPTRPHQPPTPLSWRPRCSAARSTPSDRASRQETSLRAWITSATATATLSTSIDGSTD
jgi:hypothetical protein